MATVTTTDTPRQTIVPYQGYTGQGYGAFAELRFAQETAGASTIAAPGAGNNQYVTASVSLDNEHAYVLTDAFVHLVCTGAGNVNFDNVLGSYVQFAEVSYTIPMESAGQYLSSTSGLYRKSYRMRNGYGGVMWARSGTTPLFNLNFYNGTANDQAYNFVYGGRLLMFDLDQADHMVVNSALPVRSPR